MSWHREHPELIPALIGGLSALAAGITKVVRWLVFRLVELPLTELKAELILERSETDRWQQRCERTEEELKETTKELYRSLKTSDALARRLERVRGSSSSVPPSS